MPKSCRFPRTGITLVEVLVIIAILAVLLAMIVPAIQYTREVSKRLQCANNLRQIGVALQNFHTDHYRLPPGYLGPLGPPDSPSTPAMPYSESRGPWIGSLVFVAPYLEFEKLNIKDTRQIFPVPSSGYVYNNASPMSLDMEISKEAWWFNPSNVGGRVSDRRIQVLYCPSVNEDPIDHIYAGIWTEGPHGSIGRKVSSTISTKQFTHTHYTGVAGIAGTHNPRHVGIFTNRSRVSLGQVTVADGTSNTLMFGEALGGSIKGIYDLEAFAFSWIGVGALNTAKGLIRIPDNVELTSSSSWKPYAGWTFTSVHRTGVNFCFGDNSVRLLKFCKIPAEWNSPHDPPPALPHQSDWGTLQLLAGWRDGYKVDSADIE